jgi:hypothetical protein
MFAIAGKQSYICEVAGSKQARISSLTKTNTK